MHYSMTFVLAVWFLPRTHTTWLLAQDRATRQGADWDPDVLFTAAEEGSRCCGQSCLSACGHVRALSPMRDGFCQPACCPYTCRPAQDWPCHRSLYYTVTGKRECVLADAKRIGEMLRLASQAAAYPHNLDVLMFLYSEPHSFRLCLLNCRCRHILRLARRDVVCTTVRLPIARTARGRVCCLSTKI
jgi:hypothetical protein